MEAWLLEWLKSQGIATVILVMLSWAIWRLARWTGPKIELLINTHLHFVEGVERSILENRDLIDQIIKNSQAHHTELLEAIRDTKP